MTKVLQHLSHRERLRELRLLSLEKSRFWGHFRALSSSRIFSVSLYSFAKYFPFVAVCESSPGYQRVERTFRSKISADLGSQAATSIPA